MQDILPDEAILISGFCELRVVNSKKLDMMPLGTVMFCTAKDLRTLAAMLEGGQSTEAIADFCTPFKREDRCCSKQVTA